MIRTLFIIILLGGISGGGYYLLSTEIEDDINQTLELLDDLKRYKCFFIPLNFTPLGELSENKGFPIKVNEIDGLQKQVIEKCFNHNLYWSDIFQYDLFKGSNYKLFFSMVFSVWKRKFIKKARNSGLKIEI